MSTIAPGPMTRGTYAGYFAICVHCDAEYMGPSERHYIQNILRRNGFKNKMQRFQVNMVDGVRTTGDRYDPYYSGFAGWKMTLYHFGNCLAISYIPYYLTYKYTGLSEYGAFWKCVQTVVIYALTQLCKMLVLATFFPVPILDELDAEGALRHSTFGLEFLKVSVDLMDLVGIYFALARIPGRGHSKILTAAVGWGAAELIFTRFLVLWVGAKGVEFNWKFIQMSLESNIALAQHIAITALVWLWSRHDLKQSYVPVVSSMLVAGIFKCLIVENVCDHFGLDPWTQLLAKAVATSALIVATIRVYITVA